MAAPLLQYQEVEFQLIFLLHLLLELLLNLLLHVRTEALCLKLEVFHATGRLVGSHALKVLCRHAKDHKEA